MQRSSEHASTYVVQDRSNLEELERLTIQDRMLTANMGGVLVEQPNPAILERILDVGCGTGGWLIETAKHYPTIQFLSGADISARMVTFAREQAEAQQVQDRVEFRVMDALRRLEFPNNYFDLINMRYGVSFLRTWDWPNLLQEMQRVLRPGGVIRLTESPMDPQTTSPAQAELNKILIRAFFLAGHFFSEEGDSLISHLPRLLEQHGLVEIRHIYKQTDIQAHTENAKLCFEDVSRVFHTAKPFFNKWGGIPDNYDALYQQALEEMQREDFHLLGKTMTIWGYKLSDLSIPQSLPKDEDKQVILSEREKEVLQFVSVGLSNKEIAEHLNMSEKTVNVHLRSIFNKLQVSNRAGAVGFAFRHGLLSLE